MKKILALILITTISINASGQTPNWLWALGGGGGNYQSGGGLYVSPSGDIYTSGRIAGTVTLGGKTASASGAATAFHGRFDPAGSFAWLTPYAFSGGFDYLWGFGKDNKDNTYGTGTVNSGGSPFLLKVNSAGTVMLNKTISGGGGGYAVTADDNGNIYLTGVYGSAMNFGTVTLNPIGGGSDIFIAKFDSLGNCLWAKSAGGTGYDGTRSLILDGKGNMYLCGAYSGAPTFGAITPPAAASNFNFFVAKYDTSGNALWVTAATNSGVSNSSSSWAEMAGMDIDSCGNAYVTGNFIGTAQFGGLALTSAGTQDIFVAKCLNNGTWEWAQRAGGTAADIGIAIALDKNFDLYTIGYFQGTAQFGTQTVTSAGGNDIYVSKYANSTGDVQWVQTAGGTSNDGGWSGIDVDDQGFVYITTGFGDVGGASAAFGSTTISSAAIVNIVVAKLDTVSNPHIFVTPAPSYCAGSTAVLPYTITGNFNGGNTFTAQLSDSSGSFIAPVNIGSVSATGSGSITITIPPGTPVGSHYIIRVTSSSPAWSSFDYCFRVTITSGSTGTASVSVTASDTSICAGQPVTFTTTTANAGSSPTFQWQVNGVNVGTNTPGYKDSTLQNGDAVTVIMTSSASCVSGSPDTSVAITMIVGGSSLAGIVAAVPDTVCEGTSTNLSTSGSAGTGLQWQSSTTGGFSDITGATGTTLTTTPLLQTTCYRLVAGNGTCTDTSNVFCVYVPPALTAIYTDTATGATVKFDGSGSSGDITFYSWDFGDGGTSNDSMPVHTYAVADTMYNVCLTIYDGSNCSFTFCKDVLVGPTGIAGISPQGDFLIYPNPVKNNLFIKTNNAGNILKQVELYDMLGRKMRSDNFILKDNLLTLNVSTLSKGMYCLKLITGEGTYTHRVIKQD